MIIWKTVFLNSCQIEAEDCNHSVPRCACAVRPHNREMGNDRHWNWKIKYEWITSLRITGLSVFTGLPKRLLIRIWHRARIRNELQKRRKLQLASKWQKFDIIINNRKRDGFRRKKKNGRSVNDAVQRQQWDQMFYKWQLWDIACSFIVYILVERAFSRCHVSYKS